MYMLGLDDLEKNAKSVRVQLRTELSFHKLSVTGLAIECPSPPKQLNHSIPRFENLQPVLLR
jgi:hypothetical protein